MSDPLTRLKEGKLFQWAVAYLGFAWVVWQVEDVFGDRWSIPLALERATDVLLVAGLLVTIVVAWYHGEKGRQRVSGTELVAVAVILAAAGFALHLAGGVAPGPAGAPPATEVPETTTTTIAVLPVDFEPGQDLDYLAEGLRDEVSRALVRLGFPTIHRSSVLSFRGTMTPVAEVARVLGADALVEGTIERSGDSIAIEIRLTDAHTMTYRMDEPFSVAADRTAGLDRDVAGAVAASLGLDTSTEGNTDEGQAPSPAAHEAYLRGEYHRSLDTSADRRTAIQYYEQAIALDSTYAAPYTGLESAWSGLRQTGAVPPSEADPHIIEALLAALALDNTLADAHAGLGLYRGYTEWRWEEAVAEYERAIELAPGESRPLYAHLLFIVGRPDEGLTWSQEALRLDPVNPQTRAFHAFALIFADRYAEAYDEARSILETLSSHGSALSILWMTSTMLGRDAEALDAARRFLAPRDLPVDSSLFVLGEDEADDALRARMRAIGDRLTEIERDRYVSPVTIARFYLMGDDPDQAFYWLERGLDERNPNLVYLEWIPFLDGHREDPRYLSLVQRMGFPTRNGGGPPSP